MKSSFENSKLIHNCTNDSEQKINSNILSNNLKLKALKQLFERAPKLFHDINNLRRNFH